MRICLAVAALLVATSGALAAPNWQDAQQELDATAADIAMSGNARAIAPHVKALEKALADGPAAVEAAQAGDGAVTLFADGSVEKEALLTAAAQKYPGRPVNAVVNPYAWISLYLGQYYMQSGKLDDAQRVFAAGISIDGKDGFYGHTSMDLAEQRGGLLLKLKRYPEALAAYEQGAAIPGMAKFRQSAMQRGRGAVLIELGRLDEAEAAYRAALAITPSSPIAKEGLDRIAKLRGTTPAN